MRADMALATSRATVVALVAVVAMFVTVGFAAVAAGQPPGGPGGRGGRAAGRGQGPPAGGPEGRGQPRDSGVASIATGTASVAGTVMVAGTGAPARRARVTLNAADGGGSRTATSDDEGRYSFTG